MLWSGLFTFTHGLHGWLLKCADTRFHPQFKKIVKRIWADTYGIAVYFRARQIQERFPTSPPGIWLEVISAEWGMGQSLVYRLTIFWEKKRKEKKRPVNRLTNLKMSFLSVFMHPSTEVLVLADDQCIPRGLFVLAKLLVCLPHSVNFIFTSDFFATSFPESLLSKRRETLGTRLTSLSQ